MPTCLLVRQQAQALQADTGYHASEWAGGLSLLPQRDPRAPFLLVSTPAAYEAIASRPGFGVGTFSLIIFDEVCGVGVGGGGCGRR